MLTIEEAATITGRSKKTIQRWIRQGVNIHDERTLMAHSDDQDCRSRDSSRTRMIKRLNTHPTPAPADTSDTAPVHAKLAYDAHNAVQEIRDRLSEYLDTVDPSNEIELWLAECDLKRAEGILRDLTGLIYGLLGD